MLTVFINNNPIYLTDNLQFSSEVNFFELETVDVLELMRKMEKGELDTLYLYGVNLEIVFNNFTKHFKVIKAAGGVVKNNNKEILFIYRNEIWDLPKGKLEANEEINEAAIREVEEETGVRNLSILKPLEPTYHIYTYKNTQVFKITYWFAMQTEFSGKLLPQLEEGITQVEWLNGEQTAVALENTYANIELLLKGSV